MKYVFAAGFLLCSLPPLAVAQPLQQPHVAGSPPVQDSSTYTTAVRCLKQGRRFQTAVTLLSRLCETQPDNVSYQTALGCACASRFASLAQGRKLMDDYNDATARYKERQQKWREAQSDPANPLFQSAVPTAPLLPVVPDDSSSLRLTDEQLQAQLSSLARRSDEAFRQAEKSARGSMRSDVLYDKGWALLLMRRYEALVGVLNEQVPLDQKLTVPSQDDATACFTKCAAQDKTQARYWQSLGLASVSSYFKVNAATMASKTDRAKALAALQAAVALQPKDFDLLCQAGVLARNEDSAFSAQMLESATRRNGANAVLWYVLAEQQLASRSPVPDEAKLAVTKALQSMEQGNQAPQYASLALALPVSPFLKMAWSYKPVYAAGYDFSIAGSLATSLSRVVTKTIDENQTQTTHASLSALYGMGLQLSRNVQEDALDNVDIYVRAEQRVRLFLGTTICHQAVTLAEKAYQAKPEPYWQAFLSEANRTFQKLRSREDSLSDP